MACHRARRGPGNVCLAKTSALRLCIAIDGFPEGNARTLPAGRTDATGIRPKQTEAGTTSPTTSESENPMKNVAGCSDNATNLAAAANYVRRIDQAIR